jgi:hypothetical protein
VRFVLGPQIRFIFHLNVIFIYKIEKKIGLGGKELIRIMNFGTVTRVSQMSGCETKQNEAKKMPNKPLNLETKQNQVRLRQFRFHKHLTTRTKRSFSHVFFTCLMRMDSIKHGKNMQKGCFVLFRMVVRCL